MIVKPVLFLPDASFRDHASAQKDIVDVEHGRLARRDGELRRFECDSGCTVLTQFNFTPDSVMIVPDLRLYFT